MAIAYGLWGSLPESGADRPCHSYTGRMFARIQSDIQCILERDPAARSRWDVVFSYPGFHAVVLHRMAHSCWSSGWTWLARWI